ncbi:hypothetical protein V2J09_022019, partial [Rumex salicifolius]
APPSIFRLPSPSSVVLLLLPVGASSSSFLLRYRESTKSSFLLVRPPPSIFRLPSPSSVVLLLLLLPAARIGTHPPNVAAVYRYNEQQFANPIGFDLVSLQLRRMSIANLQRCRRIACALTPKFASTGKLHPGHRRLHNGPDTIEELIDRHLVKEDKSRRDDNDEESEILARRRLTSSRREALSLYRDIIRATQFFAWSDSRGALWRDVLRENARSEFEAAKYEKDPEVITRLLIGGRDAVHQALEKLAEKQRQQLQKDLGQTL